MGRAIKNSKNFIRYYYKQAIICLILLFGFFAFRTYALTQEQIDDSNWAAKWAYSMADDITGSKAAEEAIKNVNVSFDSDEIVMGGVSIKGVKNVMTTINKMAVEVAIVFLSMTFCISLINMRENDIVSEEVFKRLVILGIGAGLCFYAKDICMNVANIGSTFTKNMADTIAMPASNETAHAIDPSDPSSMVAPASPAGSTEGNATDIFKKYVYEQTHIEPDEDANFLVKSLINPLGNVARGAGLVLQLLLPWGAMKIVGIVISVICWGRAIEIILLASFSPLAFADIIEPNNLGSSPGIRFVKNFLALSLSGAFIVAIVILCQSINASLLEGFAEGSVDFLDLTWKFVTIGFAEASLVGKASTFAKTVLGLG